MKVWMLALVGLGVLALACGPDPSTGARHSVLQPASVGGVNCPYRNGGAGEIWGNRFGATATYSVSLSPLDANAASPSGSETAGYGCGSVGDWGWLENVPCPTNQEYHYPYGTSAEAHCINPGRFFLGTPYFEGQVDWTRYGTSAGGFFVETDGVLGNGQATGNETDVIVNAGDTFQGTLTPVVHTDQTNSSDDGNWSDAVYTDLGNGSSDTLSIDPSTRWLRASAWGSLPSTAAGRLLARFLWTGDEATASGWANDIDPNSNSPLARIHYMPLGCYTMRVQFQASNNQFRSLNVPVQVGPCSYLLTTSSGSGGYVASTPTGITQSVASYSFPTGSSVSLTPYPDLHYNFTGWGGACSGSGACSVTMDAAKTVTASFTPVPVYISGPTSLPSSGTYSWIAVASFGDTYTWYYTPNGGTEVQVGTRVKYVRTVTEPVSFQLRAVVSDGQTSAQAIIHVIGPN